jgi:hypothetical protein
MLNSENSEYEPVKVIRKWQAGFNCGNALKYIARAGKKSKNAIEDLQKAVTYLEIHLQQDCYDFDKVYSNDTDSAFMPYYVSEAWALCNNLEMALLKIFLGQFDEAIISIKAAIAQKQNIDK